MAKLLFDVPYPQGGNPLVNPYPTVDRFALATLPAIASAGRGKCVIVTDGTFQHPATSGVGQAYVGGGTYENVIWNNGQAWITV